jgi:hypothetical protein
MKRQKQATWLQKKGIKFPGTVPNSSDLQDTFAEQSERGKYPLPMSDKYSLPMSDSYLGEGILGQMSQKT